MKPVILSVKAYSYSISKGDGKTSKGKHKEYLNPIYWQENISTYISLKQNNYITIKDMSTLTGAKSSIPEYINKEMDRPLGLLKQHEVKETRNQLHNL